MSGPLLEAAAMVPTSGAVSLSVGLSVGLVAVIGPDRTLLSRYLRALAGLEPPASGATRQLGRPAGEWQGEWQTLRRLVAYVSAGSALLSTSDGPRNLTLPVLYHRLLKRVQAEALADELLAEMPARIEAGQLPARLAPLARQCLLLGRALMLGPDALVAEHPLVGYDAAETEALRAYLLGPVRRRVPLLVVATSDLTVAAAADRVLFIAPAEVQVFEGWSALKASNSAAVGAFLEAARRPLKLLE